MGDSPLQVDWEADREWINEQTSWERAGPAPDIIAAGVSAREAFGGAEMVEAARLQNREQARMQWADSGATKVRRGATQLATKRCRAAREAVEASQNGRSAAPHVRDWWRLNFKLRALLDLLPLDEPIRMERLAHEDLVLQDELVVPETWRNRTPQPEREAADLFEERSRETRRGAPTVAVEVREWALRAFESYLQDGRGPENAKDEVLGVAESHDYEFSRRQLERWIADAD